MERGDLIGPRVVFLDEFRILASTRDPNANAPELIVFDTFIPPGNLPNSRQPNLPPSQPGPQLQRFSRPPR